jgi:signal recognition particle subunit SRP54
MVLGELGRKINLALKSVDQSLIVDDTVINGILNQISTALLQADVGIQLVKKLQDNIKLQLTTTKLKNKQRAIKSIVVSELTKLLECSTESYKLKKNYSNIVMFVGLQGAGKTTTCVKYAAYYKRKGWKVCLVGTDTFRAGAGEQLRQNAIKCKIPYYIDECQRDPSIVAERGVEQFKKEKYELIVVDTAGRHQQEASLFEEMISLKDIVKPDEIVFVIDSTIGQSAANQALAFKKSVNIGSVIVTKMDGHGKGGGALTAVATVERPIIFIGKGEHMEDLEPFNSRSFIGKMLGMGDIGGLIEIFKESQELEKKEEKNDMFDRLSVKPETFSLNDFRKMCDSMSKLGSMKNLLGMMPGFNEIDAGTNIEDMDCKIKRFTIIMDSMTLKEMDSDGKIFTQQPQRIVRIARGSGTSIEQVVEMIKNAVSFGAKMQPPNMKKNKKMQPPPPPRMNQKQMDLMMKQFGGQAGMQELMSKLGM